MDKENKKVNNAKPENSKVQNKNRDEFMDGFYDLNSIYNNSPRKSKAPSASGMSRAEELRIKDERRREAEMKAIKEDIERRYSLQLEDAQSRNNPNPPAPKSSAMQNLIPEIDEKEAVKEELSRIDSLISDDKIVEHAVRKEEPPKSEKQKKNKKTKRAKNEEVDFDLSEKNELYSSVYSLGDVVYRFFAGIITFIFKLIKAPFIHIKRYLKKASASTKQGTKRGFEVTVAEVARFRQEVKCGTKAILRAFRHPLSLPGVIIHYIKSAFINHRKLLKSAVNFLMPVAAFALFLIVFNYWNSVTFALELTYNEKSIGYISSEAVYIEARDMVKDRLSSSAYMAANSNQEVEVTVAKTPNFNAEYSLALVSINELNDAQAISDKIIENSVDNLTHACGVYIDGEFICAVKNEADAKTVFYDILAPYEEDAKQKGYVVGFAETIDYVQGLYPDDANVMWDAARLRETLDGTKNTQEVYIVAEGDTFETISEITKLSEVQLEALNPSYDFDDIKAGDTIVTKASVKLISIKKIITSSEDREISYKVVKKYDPSKYSGYRSVIQKGVNGTERVTKTAIYINDIPLEPTYDYETIKPPVDEIVMVGSKTSFNGVYIGEASDYGFLWPAPSCHSVSSPYGWRSSGWHNGIDLIKYGGGALGTPVIASKSGRVEVVQRSNSGYGNMVLINHGDGYKTRYAHMVKGSITVAVGDYVEAGQTIGKVGSTGNSTGPHLHFEVIVNGETQNPKNYIS